MNKQMMSGLPPLTLSDQYDTRPDIGSPVDGGVYSQDMQDPSMQELMAAYGQSGQPDMSGVVTAQDMLGRPAPQLSEQDYLALARQLGLVSDGDQSVTLGADPMTDPNYSDQYDIMSLLGGAY